MNQFDEQLDTAKAEISAILTRGKVEKARRYLILRSELIRRRTEESIRYYGWAPHKWNHPNYGQPHRIQAEFHASTARIRTFRGGNRSGKTHAGAHEAVAHATGRRPWLPETHPDYWVLDSSGKRLKPNRKVLIGTESFSETAQKVILAKLFGDAEKGETHGILPRSWVSRTKPNHEGVTCQIWLKPEFGGGRIDIMSYDQDKKVWEGSDHDAVWFDEPPPRHLWIAAWRGLTDRKGFAWFTLTPLKEAWIHNELVLNPQVDDFCVDSHDNEGYGLVAGAIDEFASHLTDAERRTRVGGQFFHLEGLIYGNYGRIHRVRRFRLPKGWRYVMHVDPHQRTAHHAVYMAQRYDDHWFVVGEVVNDMPNITKRFVEKCYEYEQEMLHVPSDAWERLVDPLAKMPNPKDGSSTFEDLWDLGMEVVCGSKDRRGAIDLMRTRLEYDQTRSIWPTISFFDDLPEIDRQMRAYQWDDWKGDAEDRDPKNEPKKKDDHLIEGVHRILREGYKPPRMMDDTEFDAEFPEHPVARASLDGYSDGY